MFEHTQASSARIVPRASPLELRGASAWATTLSMSHRRFSLILTLALLCAACRSPLEVATPHQVDLSGHWGLNAKLSMDPEAVVYAQDRRSHPRPDRRADPMEPGRVGGPLDDSPSRPPEAGVRGGAAYRKLWEKALREKIDMLSPGKQLEISQAATELSIVSGDSTTRYVYGDKVIVSVPDGVADRIAGWDGSRFVVRTSAPDGVRTARSFELANGGRQLIVITEISGDGPGATVRLVYDRLSA